MQNNGIEYFVNRDDQWKQLYLFETEDAAILRDGKENEKELLLWYILRSTNVGVKTLEAIAVSLLATN